MKMLVGIISTLQKAWFYQEFLEDVHYIKAGLPNDISSMVKLFSNCYEQRLPIQMGLLKLIEINKVINVWGVCPK